jgi:hypothetical protein
VLKKLQQLWKYSDSQPTEITLGAALMILAPICTIIELGFMPFYQVALVAAGAYQLLCISKGELHCRLRASLFTFGLYSSTLAMYLLSIGLPTPSHYGWVLLVISSFGNLKRLKTEQIHRNG